MKAVCLAGKDQVEVREVPDPATGGPDYALIEAEALSICSTDIEIIGGRMPTKTLPMVIGHEASGRVLGVGAGVRGLKEGDRVLVDPNVSDLTCPACRSGFTNLCQNGGLMGRETDGVFRERMVLPARNLHRLPKSVPPLVAPLIQPLSTAVRGMGKLEVGPGTTVMVLGLGVTGLMLTQLAKLRGATVIASSGATWKLDLARKLGADVVVGRQDGDLAARAMEATRGAGVDVVVYASNSPEALDKVHAGALKPGGSVLLFSIGSGRVAVDAYQAYLKETTIRATRSSGPKDFEEAIRLVAGGEVDLGYQVSRTLPFDRTADAIDFFRDRANVLKVVVTLGQS